MRLRKYLRLLFRVAIMGMPVSGMTQETTKDTGFLIRGTVKNAPGIASAADTATISYFISGKEVEEKVPVVHSCFVLHLPPEAAGLARFEMDKKEINYFSHFFMIEDSVVLLADKESNQLFINGGKQNQALHLYDSARDAATSKKDTLRRRAAGQLIDSIVFEEEMALVSSQMEEWSKEFIEQHPYAWQALYVLDRMVKTYLNRRWANDSGEAELKAYKQLFFGLEKQVREKGNYLRVYLENAENKTVPHFTGEMPDGSIFDLASLKGKVFLVDFWGSWCRPCRASHPHLKELYEKYRDKGFEIVGVGFEVGSREEQWKKFRKAIADDRLPWPQVLNNPEQQDIIKKYGVKGYPSKFLVDRNGRLVLRSVGSNDRSVDAKLEELLRGDVE